MSRAAPHAMNAPAIQRASSHRRARPAAAAVCGHCPRFGQFSEKSSNPWTKRPGLPRAAALLVAALLLGGAAACSRHASPRPKDSGAPLAVSLTLSTNAIHIGEPIVAELTAFHPAGARIEIPDPSGTNVIVRARDRSTHPLGSARARTDARWTITSLVVGEYLALTGSVKAVLADGTKLAEQIPEASFQVETLLGGTNDVRRAIDDTLARWPSTLPPWLWVLPLVALVALALGLMARVLWRRRAARAAVPPPPPPPHEVALAALQALRARGWIEEENVEPFYVELSAIVRQYLEARFELRAPEQTTEEFIRDAASSARLAPAHREVVERFLEQSDLVKFARHRPGRADMEAAWTSAETLVRETRPADPAVAGGGTP